MHVTSTIKNILGPALLTKLLCGRATRSSNLFIDCTTSGNQFTSDQMEIWAHIVDFAVSNYIPNSGRSLSLHFSTTARANLRIPLFPMVKYIFFYNIYPPKNPDILVTSITLHFVQHPKKKNLLEVLQRFPNLIKYSVFLHGFPHLRTHYNVGRSFLNFLPTKL
jgi:hypothetical protein